MGKYINKTSTGKGLSAFGKARELIADGAKMVSDESYQENMICVVENGMFEAAGYAFCEAEYEAFKRPDGRPKIWLVHPLASELAE